MKPPRRPTTIWSLKFPTSPGSTSASKGAEPHLVDQWNDIVTEEYTDTLNGWDGFDHQIQLHQWQMVVNGVGPLFWPHFIGWHSEAIKCRKVLVPHGDQGQRVTSWRCARSCIPIAPMSWSSFIKQGGTDDPDRRRLEHPSLQAGHHRLRQCARCAKPSEPKTMISTKGRYALVILFHGIHRSDRIFVASLFVKEFGGKVSHYMVTDQNLGHTNETYENTDEETGYLFKRRNKFDSFARFFARSSSTPAPMAPGTLSKGWGRRFTISAT